MQITAVVNCEQKKNTAISARLIEAVYVSCVCVCIFCASQSGRPEHNSVFVGLVAGVRGAVSEKNCQ